MTSELDIEDGAARRTLGLKKIVAASLGVLALGAATVAVAAPPAAAVGGNCGSSKERTERPFLPDLYNVAASCSSLQGDSKAKGVLDLVGTLDKETQWFTTIHKTYRSGKDAGPNRGTYTEIRRV
jgi:hypothetical protein